ncbi:unnamed protein product [Urochloa humidicola]
MAPPLAAPNGRRPRRPNPLRSSSSTTQAKIAAAHQMASPSPPAAAYATTGSIATAPTWMPLPPAFVPNRSSSMINSSDLNANGTTIQENCELGPHPPGGFLSYFQHSSNHSLPEEIRHQAPMSASFLYPNGSAPYAQFETPQPWMANANSSQSSAEQGTALPALGSQTAPVVDVDRVDDNGGNPRTFPKKDAGGSRACRRMIWTSDETMRLVSAWLKNSNDPIGGNWKRNDQYWGAVTAMFNSTTQVIESEKLSN